MLFYIKQAQVNVMSNMKDEIQRNMYWSFCFKLFFYTIKILDWTIKNLICKNKLFGIVYDINEDNLVSGDFITTNCSFIINFKASINYGNVKVNYLIINM